MAELTVCIPDVHAPYQHPRAMRALTKYIGDIQPDRVIQLGDFLDMLAPARWSRGQAAEYAAGVQKEAAAGHQLLAAIRAVYDGPFDYILGNHENRLNAYVTAHAPALNGIVPQVRDLLRLDDLGVVQREQPYLIAPGTVAIHGDKLSSAQNGAGQSAFKERVRHGKSIVQGHTHRLGVGYDTADRTRFWLECGWLGDIRKAGYLSFAGVANWQMGFAYLITDGAHVTPVPVPMKSDGSFYIGRQEYKG
jgi:hypothetical protein